MKKENLVAEISVRLICHRDRWQAWTQDCGKILSIQNCQNFLGKGCPCDCFEIQELDIKQRELDKVHELIKETTPAAPVKRKRGRPRKIRPPESA